MANKIALVGIGKIAIDQHVPAIAGSAQWQLAATVSRSGCVEGVESFRDFETFLKACPDIETVSLCLPPVPRYDYAIKALAAGRHVMLEKPPGATLSEAVALVDAAKKAGRSIYATWHSRQAAQVDAARDFLKDKRLKTLKITWREDVRRWHPGQNWIWQPGGLGVFDPGINALSILTKILPDPVHVLEAHLHVPENCHTPIAAQMRFFHPHGAMVEADFDFLQQGPQTWSIAAETDGGTLLLSEGGAKLALDGVDLSVKSKDDVLEGEYPRLYADMAALVARGDCDVDLSPMVLVADAFLMGQYHSVEPFYE